MTILKVLILALLAGASIPLGAILASNNKFRTFCMKYKLDSFMAALGGGALLAAIALIFVPTGMAKFTMWQASFIFLFGGVVAWRINVMQAAKENSNSQFLSMLFDFVPESLAIGVAAAMGDDAVYLLAGLAALQNMPEGFSAYHEMRTNRMSPKKIKLLFLTVPFIGPLFAGVGLTVLKMDSSFLPLLMLFSGGAIVYLIFQDIAPNARSQRHQLPALGSVIGFMIGIVGCMTIEH